MWTKTSSLCFQVPQALSNLLCARYIIPPQDSSFALLADRLFSVPVEGHIGAAHESIGCEAVFAAAVANTLELKLFAVGLNELSQYVKHEHEH